VESSTNPKENINYTNIYKEVSLVSCTHNEEKVMTKIFCIKIHMKQRKVDFFSNPSSQSNLISTELVENLGLET